MALLSRFLALPCLLLAACAAEPPQVQTVQLVYQTPRLGEAVVISITPGPAPGAAAPQPAVTTTAVAVSASEEGACDRELIVNGGFENPRMVHGSWQRFLAIEGWSLASGPNIEVQNNVAGSAHEGVQFIELDSDASSGISQSIATRSGESYELRFAFTAREGTPLSDNRLSVLWNGDKVADLFATTVNPQWRTYSLRLKGRDALSRLAFEDGGTSDSLGTYLDGVSLRRLCR
jgi:hypothetical protein